VCKSGRKTVAATTAIAASTTVAARTTEDSDVAAVVFLFVS